MIDTTITDRQALFLAIVGIPVGSKLLLISGPYISAMIEHDEDYGFTYCLETKRGHTWPSASTTEVKYWKTEGGARRALQKRLLR